MGDQDTTFKRLAALRPADVVTFVLGAAPRHVEVLGGDLPASRREADFVARVTGANGRRFVLHVECEGRLRPSLPMRILEYHVRLHLRERLPVVSVVLLLSGARGRAVEARTYAPRLGGTRSVQLWYRVLRLAALDARELVARGGVGLLPLLPLTRDGTSRALVEETVRRVREEGGAQQADLLAALAVFANVAGMLPTLYAFARRDEMRKSTFLQGFLAEGRAEGRAEGEADAVIRILQRRFGRVPAAVRRSIATERARPRLARLLDRAVEAGTLAEFVPALEGASAARRSASPRSKAPRSKAPRTRPAAKGPQPRKGRARRGS